MSEETTYKVILGALVAVGVGIVCFMAYDQYDLYQPHYKARMCLKTISKKSNEFEKAQYSYTVILEVGKSHYRLYKVFQSSTTGEWRGYEHIDEFRFLDRYGDVIGFIACEDVQALLDGKTR